MTKLAILSGLFGAGATGVGIFHHVETAPNVAAFQDMASESASPLDFQLAASYQDAAFTQVYAMWGLGALALVVGIMAVRKKDKRGFIGIGLGVIGLALSLTGVMLDRLG